MPAITKLSPLECVDLLGAGGVGRVAICGARGPRIYPVNFVVDGKSIIFRTSALSALGALDSGSEIAVEVDNLDQDEKKGWSVVAYGSAETIDETKEIDILRERGLEPAPWAPGLRRTYIRLSWSEISGRVVGDDS